MCSMIKIIDYKGREHYVAPGAIAKLTEAGTSSQWHGIRCFVKLFDGTTIESGYTADYIADSIERSTRAGEKT